jgi:alpha-tubulin suppressor-like RCC1 family protein
LFCFSIFFIFHFSLGLLDQDRDDGGGGKEDEMLISLENLSLDKSLRMSLVVQISCGAEHTICRTRGGRVYGWGENSEG